MLNITISIKFNQLLRVIRYTLGVCSFYKSMECNMNIKVAGAYIALYYFMLFL